MNTIIFARLDFSLRSSSFIAGWFLCPIPFPTPFPNPLHPTPPPWKGIFRFKYQEMHFFSINTTMLFLSVKLQHQISIAWQMLSFRGKERTYTWIFFFSIRHQHFLWIVLYDLFYIQIKYESLIQRYLGNTT